jgi:hypothetical protein
MRRALVRLAARLLLAAALLTGCCCSGSAGSDGDDGGGAPRTMRFTQPPPQSSARAGGQAAPVCSIIEPAAAASSSSTQPLPSLQPLRIAVQTGGQSRVFSLTLPAGYAAAPAGSLPVSLALQGAIQAAAQFLNESRADARAADAGFVSIAPEATCVSTGGATPPVCRWAQSWVRAARCAQAALAGANAIMTMTHRKRRRRLITVMLRTRSCCRGMTRWRSCGTPSAACATRCAWLR